MHPCGLWKPPTFFVRPMTSSHKTGSGEFTLRVVRWLARARVSINFLSVEPATKLSWKMPCLNGKADVIFVRCPTIKISTQRVWVLAFRCVLTSALLCVVRLACYTWKFDDRCCDVTSRGQNNKHLQSFFTSRVSLSYYILIKTDLFFF